ncbi:response regulator transcription factor [Syntrophobotulus glycolicus]|uniref:response regulator transcription factor n=1 Tax=Syntrophobotulus glycolicus TaxID=51197 RepID=UPI001FA7C640|nr:response regulator transcription factor [Syntrophobotulus glycolicus]
MSAGIALALKDSEFTFVRAKNLAEAGQHIQSAAFDLIILDLNLPDGNGLDFLKTLRRSSAVPVIILTANDLEIDVVTGLELGADDYLTKPFSLMILRARVKARLRSGPSPAWDRIEIDGFRFSFDQMEFFKNGVPVELSKTEQKLLRLFLANRGHTLTRARLVDAIWTNGSGYVEENALSVAVKRLRDKLEDTPSSPRYIKTVYGIGYTWVAQ